MFKVDIVTSLDVPKEELDQFIFDSELDVGYLLRVQYNGKTIFLMSDDVEPEDATFTRGFSDVVSMIERAYKLGRKDEAEARKNVKNQGLMFKKP